MRKVILLVALVLLFAAVQISLSAETKDRVIAPFDYGQVAGGGGVSDFDSCPANFIVPRDSDEVTIPGNVVLGDSNKTITIPSVGVNGVGNKGAKLRFYSIYKPGALFEGNSGYINMFVDSTQTDDRSGWLVIEGGNYVSNNGYRQGNILIESPRIDISAAGMWWNPTMDTPGYLRLLAGHPDTTSITVGNGAVTITGALTIGNTTSGDIQVNGGEVLAKFVKIGSHCAVVLNAADTFWIAQDTTSF
jgi:hypothetical protein